MNYNSGRGNSPRSRKKPCLIALRALVIAGVLAFAAREFVLCRGAQGQTARTGGERTVMVIFGCQVRKDGPSVLLRDRLDTALEYWAEHPDIHIVVSGGKGDAEHESEAQCMYDYLTAHGVEGENILMESRSVNTYQNVYGTLNLLWVDPNYWEFTPDSYVLVSSDFHLSRILMLWGRGFGTTSNVTTVPAPVTNVPYRVQMLFREPLALVKSFVFDRDFPADS